jgi:N,N'-diacetyllegionaminate synthase
MKFNSEIIVGNKKISRDSPTFVIAEAGVNHGGDMDVAIKLIDLATKAGADAVKFQTFKADDLILKNIQKAPYQLKTTDNQESQYEMLKRLEVTQAQNHKLKAHCEKQGIIFLTTPFDEVSLEELDELSLPAYKVASTDTTNLPFLEKIAKKKKPIFLSTGMSYLQEVEVALKTIYKHNKDVVLLQCTANYPIENHEANLNVIRTYLDYFDVLVGYSDHTVGVGAAPYAVPMGAKVVEKHFTWDKSLEGPDHLASLSPDELFEFIKNIRIVDTYMGSAIKKPTLSELKTRQTLQKCLVASKAIKVGEVFTLDNLVGKRTGGNGVSPMYIDDIVGRKSDRGYQANEVISL